MANHPMQTEFVDGPLAGTCHEVYDGFTAPDKMQTEDGYWYQIDDGKGYYIRTEDSHADR